MFFEPKGTFVRSMASQIGALTKTSSLLAGWSPAYERQA